MSLLKEYDEKNLAVEEWLSWGGITLPHVMQQKGGYEPYERDYLTKKLDLPRFRRGWAVWNERQHTLTTDKDFIVIFWNPFETKINPHIENTLGETVDKKNFLKYFGAGIFQSHAGKITGISRADEFSFVRAGNGRNRSKNARRAALYGRIVVAGRAI